MSASKMIRVVDPTTLEMALNGVFCAVVFFCFCVLGFSWVLFFFFFVFFFFFLVFFFFFFFFFLFFFFFFFFLVFFVFFFFSLSTVPVRNRPNFPARK